MKDLNILPGQPAFERWMAKKLRQKKYGPETLDLYGGTPDTIAVVVHVIHNGEPYGTGVNISDEQIYSQIEVLNEDFRRKNSDTVNTQPEFINIASSLNVVFVLARQNEVGELTTGIVRKQGPKDFYNIRLVSERELLSSVSHWDPDIYLNIWVTDAASPDIGIAQFPLYDDPGLNDKPNRDNVATDGVVIDYRAFGSSAKVPGLDLMPKYNLGRTTTHEIGHFFGLLHVWGDDTSISGCTIDDYVDDTPISNNDYSGECVPVNHVSCETNDMYENYMYYTDDACMNAITQQQVDRMAVIILNSPRRATLLNSRGTKYPGDKVLDLALKAIRSPGRVACDEKIDPVLEIKNLGNTPVSSFGYNLTVDDFTYSYQYDGDTIFPSQTITIALDAIPLENGVHRIEAEISNIPGDVDPSNNVIKRIFVLDLQKDIIPLREQFEVTSLEETNWITINEDSDKGWELTSAPMITADNVAAFMNLYDYSQKSENDWLISPNLDFTGSTEPAMTFKTSYALNTGFNDQLQVIASKDCGAHFDAVLAIYNSPDMAVTSSGSYWKPSGKNDWKTYSADLSRYAGEQNVRVAFRVTNGYGNNLYLDDIEFFLDSDDQRVTSALNSFTLYPNPSKMGLFQLAFNTRERQTVAVYIYDSMGRMLNMKEYPNTLNQIYYYDMTGLPSGVYYINARGEKFARTKKLLINR